MSTEMFVVTQTLHIQTHLIREGPTKQKKSIFSIKNLLTHVLQKCIFLFFFSNIIPKNDADIEILTMVYLTGFPFYAFNIIFFLSFFQQ